MDLITAAHIAVHTHTDQIQVVAVPHIQQHHAVIHTHMDSILVVDVLLIQQLLVVAGMEHVLFVTHIQLNLVVHHMDIMRVVQQDIRIIIILVVKLILLIHAVQTNIHTIHILAVLLILITHIREEQFALFIICVQ